MTCPRCNGFMGAAYYGEVHCVNCGYVAYTDARTFQFAMAIAGSVGTFRAPKRGVKGVAV
jgi:hypothetical protein